MKRTIGNREDMKKIINTFAAFAVAFSMVSCAKDNTVFETSRRAIIFASTENGITKTALYGNDTDGYDVVWSEGDSFKIGGNVFTLVEGEGSSMGKFEGTVPSDGKYTIYFPSSYNGTFPTVSDYSSGAVTNYPMKATVTVSKGEISPIKFKNAGGILRLHARSSEPYEAMSITVRADGLEDIYVNCANGSSGLSLTDDGAVFNIPMPEGSFSNVVVTMKSCFVSSSKKMTSKNLVIERSGITTASLTFNEFNSIPGAIMHLFSVSDSKQVFFSKGNLWCDTSDNPGEDNLHLEENQYDSAASRDESHISHFMWSDTAAGAVALTYDGKVASRFFADGKFSVAGTDTWRLLTHKEWMYLFDQIPSSTNSRKGRCYGGGSPVSVCGEACVVIVPDCWDLEANPIQGSYNAASWAEAEAAGAVCIPLAGYRNHYEDESVKGYDKEGNGLYGFYWSSDAYSQDNNYAYSLRLYLGGINTEWFNKNMAFSVRLVTD